LFYGRGGFDVIDPRHFPYRQPDFRDPALIAQSGDRPVPFMLLLRRVGREREARLPIGEAKAVIQLSTTTSPSSASRRTWSAASTWC